MIKFYGSLAIGLVVILLIVHTLQNIKDETYQRGYAAGADTISENHVNEICMQWLFQSDLEKARRKVCGK
jgi:hypothetical protein